MKKLFTSESVTEGHPDKIADQISDAILDAVLEQDPMARVACETLVATGQVHIVGEITTNCYVDIPKIARETIVEIGYDRAKYGFEKDLLPISKIHGKVFKDKEIDIICLYHPAVALYNGSMRKVLLEDFKVLKTYI